MNFQKVKAVIFDLDGTLLDTLADIGTGLNTALCRFGFEEHPIDSYRQRIGHGIKNAVRASLPETATEEQYQEMLDFYLSYYPQHCTEKTDYFPGTKAFLDFLTQKGMKLAVISNKTETTAKKVMDHYFADYTWEFIWGRTEGRPLKPAKEAGVLACEALSLQPDEIMYVGDGDTDMEFASNMGFIAAAVTWGYRDRDQLKAAGADFFVDTWEELQEKMQ